MGKILYSLVAIAIIYAANLYSTNTQRLRVKVLHCYDGDTCRISVNHALSLSVRLAGIDAPEIRGRATRKTQPFSKEARDFLNQLIKDKIVELRQTDLDRYNRPVVELYLNGKLINLELIKRGYAEVYQGPAKDLNPLDYYSSQAAAKANKRGIWSLTHYMPPVEFRKRNRKRN